MDKYKKNILIAFFLIRSALFMAQNAPIIAPDRTLDSLLNIVLTQKEDSNKIKNFNKIAWLYIDASNYEKAIEYASLSLAMSEKIGFTLGKGKSNYIIAYILDFQGKYSEAIKTYLMAIKIFNVAGNKGGSANCYANLGNIYTLLGNYPEAIQSLLKGQKIYDEINDTSGISGSYNNIGAIYFRQNDFEHALKNYILSLELCRKIKDMDGITICCNNIGIIYITQKKFDEALNRYQEALQIAIETDNKFNLATSRNNIGNAYYHKGETARLEKKFKLAKQMNDSALFHYFAALKIREETGDNPGIATTLINIAETYQEQNNYASAEKFLKKGLQLAEQLHSKEDLLFIYNALAKIDSSQNNFASSFKNFRLYISYRDSLFNEENTKKTVQAQMQYDFDKQHLADSIRNNEKARQEEIKHEQKIKQQRTYMYGGIIGFGLMIIVAGISFRAYRQKRKANSIITEQKKMVDEKQKEILDSIRYAQKIQSALITSEKYIEKAIDKLKQG